MTFSVSKSNFWSLVLSRVIFPNISGSLEI